MSFERLQLLQQLTNDMLSYIDCRVDRIFVSTIPDAIKVIRMDIKPAFLKEVRQNNDGYLSVKEFKFIDEMFEKLIPRYIKDVFVKRWVVMSELY